MFHRIAPTIEFLARDITELSPYPGNANQGDEEAIAESLTVNGQYRPIVVDAGSGEILAGNTTYAAALSLGWTHIAATAVTVTAEQALRIVLADNRTAQRSVMDNGLLLGLLTALPDLSGTGYERADFDRLEASLAAPLDLSDLAGSREGVCPACGK
jgi:ParB-like chromosome segregation protein Spo0J